jgi:hypothetical protein
MLCLTETRDAGRTFVADSRIAGSSFARDMTAASSKLTTAVGRSGDRLLRELHKEGLQWRELVLQTREAYAEAARDRLQNVERRAVSAREALNADALQLALLQTAAEALAWARRQLEGEPRTPASKQADIPLDDYDQLTARDLVSRVQRLTAPQAIALLDYERTRKKRATVIRAAEQRLEMAG